MFRLSTWAEVVIVCVIHSFGSLLAPSIRALFAHCYTFASCVHPAFSICEKSTLTYYHSISLKGTVSRDFWPFFAEKIWPGPQMNRQKKVFECVYTSNPPYLKKNLDFRILRSNIFAKTKKFAKPFLPNHMGPRPNVLSKKK